MRVLGLHSPEVVSDERFHLREGVLVLGFVPWKRPHILRATGQRDRDAMAAHENGFVRDHEHRIVTDDGLVLIVSVG